MMGAKRACAAAVLAAAGLVLGGAAPQAAAAPGAGIVPDTPPGKERIVQRIARVLADGEGRTAARLICDNGFADEMSGLGHTLSAADFLLVRRGATEARIDRFAGAVNDAYRLAAVPRDVAGGSFLIGLGDIMAGYAGAPAEPVGFWSAQAAIGGGILVRAGQEWAASPVPQAPCSASF